MAKYRPDHLPPIVVEAPIDERGVSHRGTDLCHLHPGEGTEPVEIAQRELDRGEARVSLGGPAHAAQGRGDRGAENRVVVEDEVRGGGVVRKGLA